ncbi:MAG: hypothetical protein PF795_04195 [Kiritimatiellae bacterium]|nr:hypothetical protein [Kiritimatiellia bacterium]
METEGRWTIEASIPLEHLAGFPEAREGERISGASTLLDSDGGKADSRQLLGNPKRPATWPYVILGEER